MKKLLITGFDPFGGESINPSWEAARKLPEEIGDYRLTKLQIPTIFGKAAEVVLSVAKDLCPDVILCVGQAGGRKGITPEVVTINLREARSPDNAGNQPVNTPVVEGGPAAYFATVPVRDMVRVINAAGIPSELSFSAGTFVCNDLLYSLLHNYHKTETLVGFIHVPFLPEQAKDKFPSLPLEQIEAGLIEAIKVLSVTKQHSFGKGD